MNPEKARNFMTQKTHDIFHYSGIIHVHSTFSDGTKTIPQIAAIANELDVDFLLITDHNTIRGKLEGQEGWYGRVLVGVGCEINDARDHNHYLAFNIREPIPHPLSAQDYLCRVRAQGGFGFIAHPHESRSSMPEYPPYPWTLWDSDCFDGIEIWNQMSEWMEGLTHKNKYLRALHPRRSIIAPKQETLKKWDELNITRKVPAIGGVDAHGYIHKLWGFIPKKIFPYKVSFRTIRTHVLTWEEVRPAIPPKRALQIIYQALRRGHSFISHNYLGNADAFRFWGENPDDRAIMGQTISLKPETTLQVTLPAAAECTLIFNGRRVAVSRDEVPRFRVTEKGVYRVEVHRKKRLWILSNHIRVV